MVKAYNQMMKMRVVVLGAGFGGLELTSKLHEAVGEHIDLTLVDRSDCFVFGFSKIDVLFSKQTADQVQCPYRNIMKPGVRFLQETVTAIDPVARRVTTDRGNYDADVLVIALGADVDPAATPGLAEGGHEFYSLPGAVRARSALASFSKGRAIIGVASAPFKCPPAPSEAALLLDDFLTERGVRDACEISLVMPFPAPVPPSPDTSKALLAAFAERNITFVPGRSVQALDPARRVAVLDDGGEMPYDLFLGVPRHRAPDVVVSCGLTENGWIPVDQKTLATRFPGVFAIGDVTSVGTPKAGVFAEGAARTVAEILIARVKGGDPPAAFDGAGSCYLEFGRNQVGRVDVNFFSGASPTNMFNAPSAELSSEKQRFGQTRRTKWFGA
jgi:sulfide:quinone oxidoreductase